MLRISLGVSETSFRKRPGRSTQQCVASVSKQEAQTNVRASANGYREGPIVTDKSAIVHAVADCKHIFFLLSLFLFFDNLVSWSQGI